MLLLVMAALSMIGVAATLFWRDRAVLSIPRVALWIEEHFPSLEYTLVTAVETGNDQLVPCRRCDDAGRRSRGGARCVSSERRCW